MSEYDKTDGAGNPPEMIHVILDDGEYFKKTMNAALPQAGGDIELISKAGATSKGRPGVLIAFKAVLPDGTVHGVQATVTWTLLRQAIQILEARHGNPDEPSVGVRFDN